MFCISSALVCKRLLSTGPTGNVAGLSGKLLKIQRTQSPKQKLSLNQLVFGQSFTDHMLTVEWQAGKGMLNMQLESSGAWTDGIL